MKVFITGYKGYVGSELVKRGFAPLVCDITNPLEIEKAIKYSKPSLVVHLASKSGVDWCENKRNHGEAFNVNVKGTYLLFRGLADARIPGVFISSDHVWGGGLFENHAEHARRTARTLPVNNYGLYKVAAETELNGGKIVRTSYLFDSKRLREHLYDMEIGNPKSYPVFIRRSFMYLGDFCDQLERYCQNFYRMPKVLHLSGSEVVSWYGFMKETARQYGWKGVVKPRFFDNKSGAPRPWFGGLNTKLSRSYGFPAIPYADGILRMRSES